MKFWGYISVILVAAAGLVSCDGHKTDEPAENPEKVLLLYSAGFNSLSTYLQEDVKELLGGTYIPARNEDILLIFSKYKPAIGGYSTQTSPVLERVYKENSKLVRDTLLIMEKGTLSVAESTVNKVLSFIHDKWPDCSYGMIFSSHATGWLPTGYYSNSSYYDNLSSGNAAPRIKLPAGAAPWVEPEYKEGFPVVKSVGQEVSIVNGSSVSYEMGVDGFASAFPMHFDYILFDTCLMGGVEAAYALRNVTDYVGFSQAEVLSDGLDYRTICSRLLSPSSTPDPKSVCEDYINQYMEQDGLYKSATYSLIKTSGLDDLAATCSLIFEKYRESISNVVNYKSIQGFFGGGRHWFFDLKDILVNAGVSDTDKAIIDNKLKACVEYKGHTGQYYSAVDCIVHPISSFCGLSMYLPAAGSQYLDEYYKTLSWNKASSLVK